MRLTRVAAACAAGLFALCGQTQVVAAQEMQKEIFAVPGSAAKSATVQSLASRATSTPGATVYGAFSLSNSTTVYILVRGPSLRTLGVTTNALDAPWTRLFDASGSDIVRTAGTPGFTTCLASASTDAPVISYYQTVRNAPVDSRDSCIATTLPPGAYTFSVTPSLPGSTSPAGGVASSPSSGEILFEVTLGPTAPAGNDNQSKTAQLVGGTWTHNYNIGSSPFSNRYSFTSVSPSTSVAGDYVARGTDEFGGLVVGSYVSQTRQWAVLDTGIIIDRFYVFTFLDNNRISGCYHQVNPSGSTNIGQCYSMTGSRFPLKSATSRFDFATEEREAHAAESQALETDPMVVESYLRARSQLKQ